MHHHHQRLDRVGKAGHLMCMWCVPCGDTSLLISQILSTCDIDGDGLVTQDEFVTALRSQSSLFDTFVDSITVSVRPWRFLRVLCGESVRLTLGRSMPAPKLATVAKSFPFLMFLTWREICSFATAPESCGGCHAWFQATARQVYYGGCGTSHG